MEEEAEKIREMQNAVDLKMNMSSPGLGMFVKEVILTSTNQKI